MTLYYDTLTLGLNIVMPVYCVQYTMQYRPEHSTGQVAITLSIVSVLAWVHPFKSTDSRPTLFKTKVSCFWFLPHSS